MAATQALLKQTFAAALRPQVSLSRKPAVSRVITAAARGAEAGVALSKPDRLWEIGSDYWFPFSPYEPPSYLSGALPGDRGFDPFQLGASWGNPPDGSTDSDSRIRWLLEGELYNGRLAMLAIVGTLYVEAIGKNPFVYNGPGDLTLPFVGGVIALHAVVGSFELKRLNNWKEGLEPGYFGSTGVFDPAGLGDDYKKQAEVRNARLAMLSYLGYVVQYWATGLTPIAAAKAHLSDPFAHNIFTYGDKGIYTVYTFLAFSVWLHVAEATRKK